MVNTWFPMVTIITKKYFKQFFSSKKKRSSRDMPGEVLPYERGGDSRRLA